LKKLSETEVIKLDQKNYAEWDKLVDNSPQGTIFHHTNWLTHFKGLMNLRILGCFKKDQLIGGCVINVHRDWFLKSVANFGIEQVVVPYEGVVLKKFPENTKVRAIERFYRDVCEAFSNYFESEGFHYVRLVNSPGVVDVRPFTSMEWDSKVKYTYYLDLPTANLKNFSRDVRRNIKKAEKYEIILEKSNNAQTFFELYRQMLTRKDQLIAAKLMKKIFERIIPQLKKKGLGQMLIAKSSSGQAMSGEIILFDKKRAYGWLAATHSDFLNTGVSSKLRYYLIQELQKNGFSEIDLVGADGWGTSDFKAGFNPRFVSYYIVIKSSFTHKMASNINNVLKRVLR